MADLGQLAINYKCWGCTPAFVFETICVLAIIQPPNWNGKSICTPYNVTASSCYVSFLHIITLEKKKVFALFFLQFQSASYAQCLTFTCNESAIDYDCEHGAYIPYFKRKSTDKTAAAANSRITILDTGKRMLDFFFPRKCCIIDTARSFVST